jgi:hypothetical protein
VCKVLTGLSFIHHSAILDLLFDTGLNRFERVKMEEWKKEEK